MSIQIKTIAVTGEKQTEIMNLTTPDLRNGEALKVNFEIPAYVIAVFSNGLILCTNESEKKLIVLDKSGKVVSRFSFAGIVCRAFSDGNKIFIVEQRGPNPNGLVYDELFNETSTHVWELIPTN